MSGFFGFLERITVCVENYTAKKILKVEKEIALLEKEDQETGDLADKVFPDNASMSPDGLVKGKLPPTSEDFPYTVEPIESAESAVPVPSQESPNSSEDLSLLNPKALKLMLEGRGIEVKKGTRAKTMVKMLTEILDKEKAAGSEAPSDPESKENVSDFLETPGTIPTEKEKVTKELVRKALIGYEESFNDPREGQKAIVAVLREVGVKTFDELTFDKYPAVLKIIDIEVTPTGISKVAPPEPNRGIVEEKEITADDVRKVLTAYRDTFSTKSIGDEKVVAFVKRFFPAGTKMKDIRISDVSPTKYKAMVERASILLEDRRQKSGKGDE